MALLMCQPASRRRACRGRNRKSPEGQPYRARDQLSSRHTKRRRPLVINGTGGDRWPKGAEKIVSRLARIEDLKLYYEMDGFLTGRTANGDKMIWPDYYVPEYDLYIEVTVGQTYDKQRKIDGAVRIARTRGRDLVILLFDAELINRLKWREVTLRDAIEQALAEQVQVQEALWLEAAA
jgi:hypothetical protein